MARITQSLRWLGAALALAATVQGAAAQSPACQRIAQQLSSLSFDGGADPAEAAAVNRQVQAQRAEIGRVIGYMRQVGCDAQGLQPGGDLSPECAPLRQRLRGLQQAVARLNQQSLQADRASKTARRQTLLDSYEAYGCTDAVYDGDAASVPYGRPQRDTFFDATNQSRRSGVTIAPPVPGGAGGGTVIPPLPDDNDFPGSSVSIDDAFRSSPQPPKQGFGGRQPVCVRLCDGFFFPLAGAPGPEEAQNICQAQCPQTKTSVFLRAPGGEISDATDLEGRTYSSLPNALKYRTKTDEACTCRKSNQSWDATLKPAEELLEKKSDDLVVTEKNADEIAKGKLKPGADVKPAPKRGPAKAEAELFSDVPLRTEQRPNVRIIDTSKARVP